MKNRIIRMINKTKKVTNEFVSYTKSLTTKTSKFLDNNGSEDFRDGIVVCYLFMMMCFSLDAIMKRITNKK